MQNRSEEKTLNARNLPPTPPHTPPYKMGQWEGWALPFSSKQLALAADRTQKQLERETVCRNTWSERNYISKPALTQTIPTCWRKEVQILASAFFPGSVRLQDLSVSRKSGNHSGFKRKQPFSISDGTTNINQVYCPFAWFNSALLFNTDDSGWFWPPQMSIHLARAVVSKCGISGAVI